MNASECEYLIAQDMLTASDVEHAREASDGDDVEPVLMDMELLDITRLGNALSELYCLPYQPLSDAGAISTDGTVMSHACCTHWGVVPVRDDPAGNIVTLCVPDAETAQAMQRIYTFLMKPFDVAFTVASRTEIASVLAPSAKRPAPTRDKPDAQQPEQKQKLKIPMPKEKAKQGSGSTSDKPSALGERSPRKSSKWSVSPVEQSEDSKTAHELSRALINAVALLVKSCLAGDPAHLSWVRARVRYAQLLAARLQANNLEFTKTMIAAWSASLSDRADLIKPLMLPFDVEEILEPTTHTDHDLASHLVRLVMSYEAFLAGVDAENADVSVVRSRLQMTCNVATDHSDILEAFLQVLMDEQFLRPFNAAEGSVLIVDPRGGLFSEVEHPLSQAGCRVEAVSTVRLARESLQTTQPDLLIADAEGSGPAILELCRDTRSTYPDVKLIVVSPTDAPHVRHADFLRAGVDDMLASPLDLEVFFITVEKLLKQDQPIIHDQREGVSGSLSDMSFNDMIQVLSAGAKDVHITVTRGSEHGDVFMRNGDIIHCKLNDQEGPDAFYALMHWQEGDFAAVQCDDFPPQTITVSTMSLLMEGARQLDEELAE